MNNMWSLVLASALAIASGMIFQIIDTCKIMYMEMQTDQNIPFDSLIKFF